MTGGLTWVEVLTGLANQARWDEHLSDPSTTVSNTHQTGALS